MTYKKQISLILTLIINFLQYDKYKFDTCHYRCRPNANNLKIGI